MILSFHHRTRFALPVFLTLAVPFTSTNARAQATKAVPPVRTQNRVAYTWKNVKVGGAGCWVTGIEIHPKAPYATYIRTDVGGAMRWDNAQSRWISLSNHFSYPEANNYGVESLALDANAPNVVYMACGLYADRGNTPGALFKSVDQGKNWTKLGLTVPMGANQERRWGGERLVVSPHNGQVLLFGSRRNGLWRSVDSGVTWQQNAAIPVANDNLGVVAVAFDPKSPGVAYASVSGAGIYRSQDNGVTWELVPGSPQEVRRLMVTTEGSLWATHATGVSKYAGGTWNNMMPGGKPDPYCGIAINPKNPNDILVSDLETFKASDSGRLWRSFDAGTTWKRVPAVHQVTIPGGRQFQIYRVSGLAFNPTNTKQVWTVSGAGVMQTNDIEAPTVTFTSIEDGHEETCINMLATPPSGPELVSGMLDVDGFVHDRGLDQYPSHALKVAKGNWIAYTLSLAYQEKNPRNMMRTGTQGKSGAVPSVVVSSDAGATWNPVSFPAGLLPLHGVISATAPQNMVVMCNSSVSQSPSGWQPTPVEHPWQYTRDGGATWQPCAGLPRTVAPTQNGIYGTKKRLVADPENGGTFSVLGQDDGKIYRSTDGGATFSIANLDAGQSLPTLRASQLKTQPGAGNTLWAGFTQDSLSFHAANRLPNEGLFQSIDGGAHWQRLPNVASVVNFAFGKAAPTAKTATLYLYGRLNGDTVDKIYRTTDLGASWQDITDPSIRVGNQPLAMEGSRQTFGRIFIGTNGSGIFYGDAAR